MLRFYRNERIFLLQCVRHTLTNALDPASQYHRHSAQFVDCHLKPALFDVCWEQFETSVTTVGAQDSHRVRGGEGWEGRGRGGEGMGGKGEGRGGEGREGGGDGRVGLLLMLCVSVRVMQTPEMVQESSLWDLQEQVSCCCLPCSAALPLSTSCPGSRPAG